MKPRTTSRWNTLVHFNLDSHASLTLRTHTQATHWPEAKRAFQPIDVEYLSCECRKYYSYVNGTKKYEGKNVFRPGKSPMLTFDAEPIRAAGVKAAAKVRLQGVRLQREIKGMHT